MKTLRILSIGFFVLGITACSNASEARTPVQTSASSSISKSSSNLQKRLDERTQKRMANASSRSSISSASVTVTPRPDLKIPILVYHHVRKQEGWAKSTWSWKMTVTPETFEKHMKWLQDHGYTSIDLDAYVQIREAKISGPEKPVVITFDDNNLNAYDTGAPIMEKYGMTATFYQITNHLKNQQTIDEERTKDLVARGFSIQSHTLSHPVLPNVDAARLKNELEHSKWLLEQLTGKPILHIAYPGTSHNQRVRDAAKAAGYVTGTIMDPRSTVATDDYMKLPRIMMTDDTNLEKILP